MLHQVWFQKEGQALPQYGIPDSLKFLGDEKISVTFPSSPFVRAIAKNEDFSPQKNCTITRILQARLNRKAEGTLTLIGSLPLFMVNRQYRDSGVVAYIKLENNTAEPLQVVDVGTPLAENQITIDNGGIVRGHPHLANKTISARCPLIIPMAIDRRLPCPPLPEGAIDLLVVGQDAEDVYKLITFQGVQALDFEAIGSNVSLTLSFSSVVEVSL